MGRTGLTLLAVAAFTAMGVAAPVPKGMKAKPVRAKIAPLKGEKTFEVDWVDKPLTEVMEKLEDLTELLSLSKDIPDVRMTVRTGEKVCAAELFAQVNDELLTKGWALVRKAQSFNVLRTDAPLPRLWVQTVTEDEFARRCPDEPVQYLLAVYNEEGLAIGLKAAGKIDHKWFDASEFGGDKLIVRGRKADILKVAEAVEEHAKPIREAAAEKRRQLELEMFGPNGRARPAPMPFQRQWQE